MVKVLHLISEKPPIKSGFARAVGRLAEELEKMGHEVDVLSAHDCNFRALGEIKVVLGAGNINRSIDSKYDIVHIHGHTPTFSDRLLFRSKLSRKKVVYTLHCLVNYYFKPMGVLYNSFFNNISLKLADAVVVTSKSYFDMLRAVPRKYLVPWGVDRDQFGGTRVPHEGYRLLFVGQMRPYKGLKILLRAVKGLDATLSVVGEGPDLAEYENLARKLDLNNVHFYGGVSDDVLRSLYLSSDVLLLPSLSVNEAFGLVTLEAATAGCAVVASDLPGVRDVVKDFGILVKPSDLLSLRGALLTLEDEEVRRTYVQKGLDIVPKYSWSRVAEQYSGIYNKMLSGTLDP